MNKYFVKITKKCKFETINEQLYTDINSITKHYQNYISVDKRN